MAGEVHVIERAFQLASSGDFATVNHIVAALSAEGYPNPRGQLIGPTLRRQLSDACQTARGGKTVAENAKASNEKRRQRVAVKRQKAD